MASAVLAGFILGFAIAGTPGPITLLTVRRTLEKGWLSGLVSGLGVATVDAAYAALSAFGVVAITAVLLGQSRWIRLGGGLALLYIGIRTLTAKPATGPRAAPTPRSLASDYGSMMALTFTNPLTILSFAAVFAGLGLRAGGGHPVALVAGVLLGSVTLWIGLTGVLALSRRQLSPRVIVLATRASGAIIAIFGLLALASVLRGA